MNASAQIPSPSTALRLVLGLLCAIGALLISGCVSGGRSPATTHLSPEPVKLPARLLSNFFLVESRQADGKTYRFMIDTGSSVTLVSPAFGEAVKQKERRGAPPRTLPVRGANGREVDLPAITLREFWLGKARFDRVPAIVYDFSDLSSHLGLTIDGVIGYPLFH